MKVFVAGATGVLGRALVPQLVASGHDVVGMTRSASKQELVRSLGAHPVVADALDPDAVAQAVASAEPEVIVHELTALSGKMGLRDARHPDRSPMAMMTNRLRTEGTDHLLAAGRAVGARRFVAQSFGAFRYARTGGPVLTEADPLDPDPPAALRPVVQGLLHLERAGTTIEWGEGLALRYGGFYAGGLEREGQARARLAAPVSELAAGLRGGARLSATDLSAEPSRRPARYAPLRARRPRRAPALRAAPHDPRVRRLHPVRRRDRVRAPRARARRRV